MNKNGEYFNHLVSDLAILRESEPDEDHFLKNHYKKIESLLELFSFKNNKTYRSFKSRYLRFWNHRLQPFRIGKCKNRTVDELKIGKAYYEEFLQVLKKIRSLYLALGPNKVAFSFSNYYALNGLILMKERGNIGQILLNWQKAGEACKPTERRNSKSLLPEDIELIAAGENYFSEKFKLQAFYSVEKQYTNYNEVISNLEKSKKHGKNALNYFQQAGNKSLEAKTVQHIDYIDYWISVFVSRQSILNKKYIESQKALQKAIKFAKKIESKDKRIFPNRFFDIKDLENESKFIQACEVLLKADLESCKKFLDMWLERSDKIRGTWRHLNIALRKEAVECLIYRYIYKDKNAYSKALLSLKERINSRANIGQHTRRLINIVEKESFSKKEICSELFNVFPLDAYPPSLYEDKSYILPREEKLRQLPSFLRDWLDISFLGNKKAFLTIDYIFLACLRVITEYCYQHSNILKTYGKIEKEIPENFPTGFDKLKWEDIKRAIESLSGILETSRKGPFLQVLSSYINSYLDKTSKIRKNFPELDRKESDCSRFFMKDLATEILNILIETGGYLFPLPVKVRDIVEKIDTGEIIYKLEKIWSKPEKEVDLILEIGRLPLMKKNCFYFLRGQWKRKYYGYIEYFPRKDENLQEEIQPSISFGIPHKGCILLYEGDTEDVAFPELLNFINPYWTILDIQLIKGNGDDTPKKYTALRDAKAYVVTIADKDIQEKGSWRTIIANKKNTFLIDPDFEGVNLEYLVNSIKKTYPELIINIDKLDEIIRGRIELLGWKDWGGTIDGAFQEYLSIHYPKIERPKYTIRKPNLASELVKCMIQEGVPTQIEKALNRLLNLAEGREEYE